MLQETIPSLIQIMTCRLFSAKPLSDPVMTYCQLNHEEHISKQHCLKFKSFHSSKAFEDIVCEMAAILSQLQSVNRLCDKESASTSYNKVKFVFVRECGLNLADAVMQRSMSHFGRCRYCYSGALLSGSGHCCPFRVRAPVDFLHGRSIIGLRGFVPCQGVLERWPLTCPFVICNRCHFGKYPCECQEI